MGMMKNTVVAGAFALAAMAGTAGAATLSVSGGGSSITLDGDFNPAPSVTGVGSGDIFTNFTNAFAGLGLSVSGPAKIRFTFLGKEASNTNTAVELDGNTVLGDGVGDVGTFIEYMQLAAGIVTFKFSTSTGGVITNGVGGTNGDLDLAFGSIFNGGTSVIALFGDGGANNDNDYDDMVIRIDVAAVPVPAAGLMLLGALGGVAALRRRKA